MARIRGIPCKHVSSRAGEKGTRRKHTQKQKRGQTGYISRALLAPKRGQAAPRAAQLQSGKQSAHKYRILICCTFPSRKDGRPAGIPLGRPALRRPRVDPSKQTKRVGGWGGGCQFQDAMFDSGQCGSPLFVRVPGVGGFQRKPKGKPQVWRGSLTKTNPMFREL